MSRSACRAHQRREGRDLAETVGDRGEVVGPVVQNGLVQPLSRPRVSPGRRARRSGPEPDRRTFGARRAPKRAGGGVDVRERRPDAFGQQDDAFGRNDWICAVHRHDLGPCQLQPVDSLAEPRHPNTASGRKAHLGDGWRGMVFLLIHGRVAQGAAVMKDPECAASRGNRPACQSAIDSLDGDDARVQPWPATGSCARSWRRSRRSCARHSLSIGTRRHSCRRSPVPVPTIASRGIGLSRRTRWRCPLSPDCLASQLAVGPSRVRKLSHLWSRLGPCDSAASPCCDCGPPARCLRARSLLPGVVSPAAAPGRHGCIRQVARDARRQVRGIPLVSSRILRKRRCPGALAPHGCAARTGRPSARHSGRPPSRSAAR